MLNSDTNENLLRKLRLRQTTNEKIAENLRLILAEIEKEVLSFRVEECPELSVAIDNCNNEKLKKWVHERRTCDETIELEQKMFEVRKILEEVEERLVNIKAHIARIARNQLKEEISERHGFSYVTIPDNLPNEQIESFIRQCFVSDVRPKTSPGPIEASK